MQLWVLKSRDARFTYGNIVAVSPEDFPPSQVSSKLYVKLKNQFVCSAETSSGIAQGHIALSDPQRTWTVTSETHKIDVEKYNPFQEGGLPYIGSLKVEVGFGVGKKTTDTEFDEDELQQHFTKVCK